MWLWGSLSRSGAPPSGVLHGPDGQIKLCRIARESWLGGKLESLRDRAVLLLTSDQLSAALAMIELDGVARRLVLCPSGLSGEYLSAVIGDAEADACVGDAFPAAVNRLPIKVQISPVPQTVPNIAARHPSRTTDWILLTSATTGAPKLVQHSLASLVSAFADQLTAPSCAVWGTFYDIRRYGGLQIFLRGLYSGALVISQPAESLVDFLTRAGAAGVTHMTGTASHWRRVLMSGSASKIAPRYVRLSGEIADQPILDALHATYPDATVAHAFATTEAGVGFEVEDRLAGFPERLIGASDRKVDMKIVEGTLRIRSLGCALRYLGGDAPALRDADGFVDTGDRIELRDARYHFLGRSGGVINVGGLKVYPEEIEAVINAHPFVRVSLVKARRNPITGAIVAADIVLADGAASSSLQPTNEVLANEILDYCRKLLPAYKVPATVRIVASLELSAAGKLMRPNA